MEDVSGYWNGQTLQGEPMDVSFALSIAISSGAGSATVILRQHSYSEVYFTLTSLGYVKGDTMGRWRIQSMACPPPGWLSCETGAFLHI